MRPLERVARRTAVSVAARVAGHAALLVTLVSGAAFGVIQLVSYLAMLTGAMAGRVPMSASESVPVSALASGLSPARVAACVLMVVLWGGAIVAGLSALARQCRGCVGLAGWVSTVGSVPSSRLASASMSIDAGPDPAKGLVELADDARYAFTYGIWRPRIVVSSGLVADTTHEELVAVLVHEDHHRRHRDPLKVLALRTWAATLFLIPLAGALSRRMLERQELRADRAALRACGVAPVAGALLKAAGEPAAAPGTALAAMGGPALLQARVTQLETGHGPRLLAALPRDRILASVPGAALASGSGVLMLQACMVVQLYCAH